MMDTTKDFCISMNYCGFSCHVCDRPLMPCQGPELFLDGEGLVCWDCGRREVPHLVAQLEAHYEAELVLSNTEKVAG